MFLPNNRGIKTYTNGSNWHRYLYDKDDFTEKLKLIGFKSIRVVNKHESSVKELQNLERRVGGIFSAFPKEADITLEAIK